MNKKIIILLILTIVIVAGIFSFSFNKQNRDQIVTGKISAQEKIKIAACPTCYELSKKLDLGKYQVIKTNSTAQSIAFLKSGQADMILAGRTLKPDEPRMDNLLISEGYSFLSNQERAVYIDDLRDEPVYTDLNIETIKNIFTIQKIEAVENVYNYLDKGIVITSWENTDYIKAAIVHVFEESGKRVELSRRPTVYCPNICGQEAQELTLLLKQ